MTETNYPLVRGAVAGRLHILGESADQALVVLAEPGSYWQTQSEGYQFWTRCLADGSFLLPKVRPGDYTLFAHVPGIVGEFELNNVTVSPGTTNDLGSMEWQPPRRAHRLWRIGTPDLNAGEFRFGDRMRQFGLWWRYMEEQGTNDFVYRVGSNSAADWYYAQSVVAMDNGTYFSPVWKIEFTLTHLPPAPVVLTLDMAGSLRGTLLTSVNGTSLANVSLTNDACVYRSATQSGMFRHLEWLFDPALMHTGTNFIAFTVSKEASWTGTKPVQPVRGLMYDCIQLEAGNLVVEPLVRFEHAYVTGGSVLAAGSGGLPGATYVVRASTDLGGLPGLWTPVATNQFDEAGHFSFEEAIAAGAATTFYRLEVP
jgi:rhamnogalacturonan endolyase